MYIRPMPLARGTRIGNYEIVALLGVGGMGEVYRARDTRLGREVALKLLPAEVSANPERLARFEREARTVASLTHPNIVVLHTMEEAGGTHFLTMELVDGEGLDRHVTAHGLPVARVVEMGIALADALTAAHERGVIHRDLKPANVMVSRDGRVKVLDFGLAKLAQPDSAPDRTVTMTAPISEAGSVLGTVPYMAPEQIRGESADARTDLFALGILLYELAAGRRPFAGATGADVSSAILRDTPEPLARVRSDVPGDLERIVSRCLEKNPRERFQTALDVGNELRRLRKQLERGAQPAAPREAGDKVASIAVLPFVNRSASADDEYFSDGLADELLNVLAKIKGLRVIARTSSFLFKDTKDDIATIGGKLDVATILEGSVRKAGPRVRISVQLVKVSDSSHLWSETYDRTLDDVFAVQDDIAQAVVKELRTTLLGVDADSDASGEVKAEVSKAAKGRATDPEAHRLYLMGRYLIDRTTREDTTKGIAYLKQALERDPAFALAWAELANAYASEADRIWVPAAEGYERARHAVERALALEPDLAEGHAQLGWIRMVHDWDWRGAEASYARALELAPGNTAVLRRASMLPGTMGRLDEATVLSRRAVEQDPLSAAAYHILGIRLHAADRLEEAEQAYRKALELTPQRIATPAMLAMTVLAQGRGDEALGLALSEPEEAMRLWALAIVHTSLGHGAESDAALRELIAKYAGDSAYQVAQVHAARGATDAAFEWLERAYAQRDGGVVDMKISPRFRSLRGDPRWTALMKKIGFDE